MNYAILSFVLFVVYGCSAAVAPDPHYYILNYPNRIELENGFWSKNDHSRKQPSSSSTVYPLEPNCLPLVSLKVKVASYLEQSGILLQQGRHQLSAAHYHRWAEPVAEGIKRYLTLALDSGNTKKGLALWLNNRGATKEVTIMVMIDQFYGTLDGIALLAGSWQLAETESGIVLAEHRFRYKQPQDASGYASLVATLASLLDGLVANIASIVYSVEDKDF